MNISNTSLKFDENGNPNIGYTVIQRILDDKNSSETFVGSYQSEILNINKTLFKWYTNDSMVIFFYYLSEKGVKTLFFCGNQNRFLKIRFFKRLFFRYLSPNVQRIVNQVRCAE